MTTDRIPDHIHASYGEDIVAPEWMITDQTGWQSKLSLALGEAGRRPTHPRGNNK